MRTVVLTFDNLGAAAQREAGTWTGGDDEDDHVSLRVLPTLLALLGELGLPATYFVEAMNCERHPAAVASIAAAGLEVGHHAWRHERWSELDAGAEADVLGRGCDAFVALGLRVRGFRPPGGSLSPATTGLLRASGLDWCSPEGSQVEVLTDDVVSIPFRWPLVDALYRFEPFGALRAEHGLGREVLGADDAVGRLWEELSAEHVATLILHPMLMAGPGEPGAHVGLLRRLAAARDAGELRVVDGATLADEVRAGPASSSRAA